MAMVHRHTGWARAVGENTHMHTAKLEIDEIETEDVALRGFRFSISSAAACELEQHDLMLAESEPKDRSEGPVSRRRWRRVSTWLATVLRVLADLGLGGR